jgi:HD-like signal output (HDOD) protein
LLWTAGLGWKHFLQRGQCITIQKKKWGVVVTSACEQLFAKAVSLPQIPHVMREVVSSLRNEDVSIDALANLVGEDQVITAKVLRLANSSYYGARRRVAGIADAVQMIGLNTFRNLVIASAVTGVFPKIEGFDLPAFWRNSMLVANLAHYIGRDLESDRETLFSAGLMHNIGFLLLCLLENGEIQALIELEKGATLAQRRSIEQGLLGMNRFEVGMELARRWNFPESIPLAIGQYDQPGDDQLPTQVVHAAVMIAQGIQEGWVLADMENSLPPAIAERLHLDRSWFEEAGEVFDLLLDESAALA